MYVKIVVEAMIVSVMPGDISGAIIPRSDFLRERPSVDISASPANPAGMADFTDHRRGPDQRRRLLALGPSPIPQDSLISRRVEGKQWVRSTGKNMKR